MSVASTSNHSNIIFGSCNSQHYKHQPFWDVIKARQPTSFVWGGDAVYGDERPDGTKAEATPEFLRELFQEQRNNAGYKSLIESGVSIFGTIDDHDYGVNNGDKTFRWKKENAIEYVKFLDLPDDSPMMKRAKAGLGVYGVQVYDFNESDPKKRLLSDQVAALDPDVVRHVDSSKTNSDDLLNEENRRVAVFVLDVRSNRTPWRKTLKEKLFSDKEGCMLGEEQFRWFETAIGRSNAAVNIIVTGLQVHPERFYDNEEVEGWNGFPKSQHRLYQALLKPNVRAPIILSGDVHHAQFLRKDCRQMGSNALRPLYEVTTSGMTHSWGADDVGMCGKKKLSSPFCHFAKRAIIKFVYQVFPFYELIVDETTGEVQNTLDLNIADLEFDWEQQQVITRVLGQQGQTMLEQQWPFGDLTGIETTQVPSRDFDSLSHRLENGYSMPVQADSWVCVHYGGTPGSVSFAMATFATASFAFIVLTGPFLMISVLVVWFLTCSKRKKRPSRAFLSTSTKSWKGLLLSS